MASRVGRVVSKIWTRTSAARMSTPASSSAASLAGGRSLPRFSSPSVAPQQTIFGSRRSLQFSASGDVRCIFSMIPRHNVTATARLVSKLSGDLCPELEG
ncbi:hypothetical protein Mapa_014716 [Marchantia paleacea]|nr:hypothetical protein Mapa_014716 [Marchantia paleacea]